MPFIQQFSVFLPNRVGRLHELLNTLAKERVDIAGISVVDSTDWAVVRLVFTDVGRAREMLARHGVAFTEADVLAVVLEGPETLQQVCKTLVTAELNLAYAYTLLILREDNPVMALQVDDGVLARHVLTKHGFTLVDHEDL